jgi:formylglycine-generating enzyme required for sulfatase activity
MGPGASSSRRYARAHTPSALRCCVLDVIEGRSRVPATLDCEGYRLPTAAEWEYAARAGSAAPTLETGELCDTNGPTPFQAEVPRFPPNAFGLQELLGADEQRLA